MPRTECLDARGLSQADARAIAELIVRVWPKPGKTVEFRQQQLLDTALGYTSADTQAPRSFLIRDGNRVIAHSAVIPRTIGTSVGEMTIAGLARVCTDPEFRGQKLGEQVVGEVFALVDKGVFPFALFQTNPVVQPFYEKLGACIVTNRIINSFADDLHANPFWDQVIMRYPKNGNWPEGEIDLRGPGY